MTRRAFTLIELIIATVILAVILVSIYSAFSVGIKAWRRGNQGRDLQKIRITLLRMQKEMRGSFFFSEAPFKGSSSEITFPLVVPGEDKDKVYIIDYYIAEDKNTGSKALIKRKSLFMDKQILEEEKIEELMFTANSIGFEYAYELKDGLKGFEWKAAWGELQKKIPSAIRINLSLGASKDIYHKVIFIPQGELGTE